jgi:hypothetical protein
MKTRIQIIAFLVFSILVAVSCSNKKLENNIKSLEKRVAALERKQGIQPANQTTSRNVPVDTKTDLNPEGPFAEFRFDQMEYDFGVIQEGDVVEHTFTFTNTGAVPLVIQKATATCGCTVPEWPKQPISTGETGEIKIKFNSKGRKNLQTKYVNILANTSPEQTRLKIVGNVTPNS